MRRLHNAGAGGGLSWLRTSLPPLGRVLDAGGSLPSGPGIARRPGNAGQSLAFSFTLMSWRGTTYTEPLEREVRVEISGTATLIPTVLNHNNGTYDVTYMARKAGSYQIALWANDKPLGDSPYAIHISAGPIDARHCTLKGPGMGPLALPSKQDTHIIVRTADSFGNERDTGGPAVFRLAAKGVSAKSGLPWERDIHVDVQDSGDGSYKLTFRPKSGINELCLFYRDDEDEQPLPNGQWVINVLKPKQMAALETNVEKKRFFFKTTQRGSTLWVFITEKQVAIYSYLLGIVPRRLQAARLHRTLKVSIDPASATDFSLDMDDGQPPLVFASKERNVFYATYHAFVNRVVASKSFEERQQLLFAELRKAGGGYTTQVQADRAEMVQTLLRLGRTLSVDQWKGRWQITFQGEPGYDAGGLLREFFAVMGREAFRPEARLFAPLSDESATCGVHPCPSRPKLKSKSKAKANDASSKGKDKAADHDSSGDDQKKKKMKKTKAKKEGSKRKGLLGWLGGGAKDDESADVQKEKEALELYKAAGLFLAKTVWDAAVHGSAHLVDVRFTRSFRKQLLGLPPHFTDWQTDDPQFYMSKVKYLLDNDPRDLELTFTEEVFDQSGAPAGEVELKPGGRDIAVTELNRHEYLHLLAEYRLLKSSEARIGAFKEGFHSLITEELICMFDENELELLFNGLPSIDLAEFKAAVQYNSWRAGDEVVRWFWAAVESFSEEERARLLQFITGSSQLPLGGFGALTSPISINKIYGTDTLPQASTCFNRFNLPSYTSYAVLSERLLYAINEGSQGFGFA